jgi:hypothetical protein
MSNLRDNLVEEGGIKRGEKIGTWFLVAIDGARRRSPGKRRSVHAGVFSGGEEERCLLMP